MRSLHAIVPAALALAACASSTTPGAAVAPAAAAAAMAAPDAPAPAAVAVGIPDPDRVRLAEAFRLARDVGDSVWPGWSAAPFPVLLVTPDEEFLIGHPAPPATFRPVGRDTLLGADVLVRPRTFPAGFLATFPIAGPQPPVIVVGQPERTGKSSQGWVLTILHEHFHQLQFSRPDYYPGLGALGLARGDTTGMWALNYAFPYDSVEVQRRFAALTEALAAALDTTAHVVRAERAPAVAAALAQLRASVSADDARYLDFQLWQEGIARWTEWRVAALAAARFTPSPAMRALPGFVPWSEVRDSVFRAIARGTARSRLERHRREVVYPVGAALALVLDTRGTGWRDAYFARMFTMPTLPER